MMPEKRKSSTVRSEFTSSSLFTLNMFAPLVADRDTKTAPVQEGPENENYSSKLGEYYCKRCIGQLVCVGAQ